MPSFITETPQSELYHMIVEGFRQLFTQIDQEKPVVLVNTFTALEDAALRALEPYVDIVSVGPAVPPPLGEALQQWPEASDAQIHLVKAAADEEENYLEWLDARPEKSVVYLSFGSLLTYTVRQVEILHGLQDCGRRYLWVVRREGRAEDVDLCLKKKPGKQGMVVEWCDQLRVLSHPSVGCFVTHCGWNSALEAVVHGVPMVAVPVWSDQPMNAHLVEEWSVGVRAERDADGILTRSELVSCVELLMGDGDKAKKIIASANHLKKRAKDALTNDGALLNFVDRILEVPMND
jgi:UDP:flavonoid glycosyltransferase YjiC (YdhE family)